MSIDNPPVFSEPPEEPIIGTPADTFEPLYQAKMHYQLVTEPAEKQAHIAWLQSAYNSVGVELDARATAKFSSLDQLDNEGLINSLVSSRLERAYPPNLLSDGGTFFQQPHANAVAGGVFQVNELFRSYNGSVLTEEGRFIHNNSDFGGTGGYMSAGVKAIMSAYGTSTRYGTVWATMNIASGTGTASAVTVGGSTYYLASYNSSAFSGELFTLGYWVQAVDNPVAVIGKLWGVGTHGYYVIQPSDGAVYVVITTNSSVGYAPLASVRMLPNSNCVIGQPYISIGAVELRKTRMPIPTTY